MSEEKKFIAPYCVTCRKPLKLIWKCPECGTECDVGNCGIMTTEGETPSDEN